jgi:hypothetical protein
MVTFVSQYGPKDRTVEAPAASVIEPLGGAILVPGAEIDQVVGPVIFEPVLVMVNSTCPVVRLQTPSTLMLDLSQGGVGVYVGEGVLLGVSV